MRLGERIGRGCAELHDRMMVGVRCGRLELDEIWGYVAKKQKRVERHEISHKGDQYTFIGMASSAKAIISYRTGKRDSENTDLFIQDLRQRVIGAPEISTDGFLPYQNAIRDAFNGRASHGVIVKTYSVVNLAVKDAARRYSPAEVVAVEREVVSGLPSNISTSYVERQNLTLRMTQRRFARLTNGFSKKLTNHAAAVSLYVAHYNLTVALDDPADDSHVISFSGEYGRRTQENLYVLAVDRMLLSDKDRPKADGLPIPAEQASDGVCRQLGNFASREVSSITCSATDKSGRKYELSFESDGAPITLRREDFAF